MAITNSDLGQAVEKMQSAIDVGFRKSLVILDRIQKVQVKEVFSDAKFTVPMYFSDPSNFRAVSQGSTIPTPVKWTKDKAYATAVKIMGTSQITWEASVIGSKGGSLEDEVQRQIKALMRGLKKAVANQIWGHQYNGSIGKVYSVTSGSKLVTLYFTTTSGGANEPGNMWITRGDRLVIDAAADVGTSNQLYVVDKRKKGSYTDFYVTENTHLSSVAQGDIVVPGEADANNSGSNVTQYGIALTSMYDHVVDQVSTSYQGLSRSTYPELCANLSTNSGTLRALTELMLLTAEQSPMEVTGNDSDVDLLVGHPSMERAYYKVMQNLRRFIGTDKLEGADPSTLRVGKLPLTTDAFCPPGRIYGIDTSTFKWAVLDDFKFEKRNGEIYALIGAAATQDIYEARLRVFAQLIGLNPPQNWVIEDLQRGEDMS